MPANAGVDYGCARFLDRFCQRLHLVKGRPIGHQINHRQAVDQDEIRAHGFAHPAHHLQWQAHPVLVRSAPAVSALVGMGDEELVQEIPFRSHDLDPVIACLFGQHCGVHNICDLLFNAFLIQLVRREGGDRRFHRRGRHAFGPIGIATGVQDLHRDLAASLMDAAGDNGVVCHILFGGHHGRAGQNRSLKVRPNAACHHQAHTAARAFGIKLSDAVPIPGLLQTGVHGAHQDAVFQRGKAQIQRGQHVRVRSHDSLP